MIKRFPYFLLGVLCAVLFSVHTLPAQTLPDVEQQIKQAKNLYYNGQFKEAQTRLLQLISKHDLTKSQKIDALVLLAEIRRAMNDQQGARKIIRRILALNPEYSPSVNDYPPNFIKLVQEEKQAWHKTHAQAPSKPWYKKTMYLAGMGGAAILTTGILLVSKLQENSQQKKTLPLPPDWPK